MYSRIKPQIMKRLIILTFTLFFVDVVSAQGFGADKVAFSNFLIRMYENAPFDGVKIVRDYDSTYLISVLSLNKNKYAAESAMNRVASVKAMAQASRFFNGSSISDETIIKTSTNEDNMSNNDIIETIHENSVGFVKSLEMLTNFIRKDGLTVFIFITNMNNNSH